ncbi:hypothetical protein [Flagellimonas marina]|uniref:Transglycosylase SLT domain-containing protein n=1 Tax=Flagellimonas marina TaxID=1775168 RepID=A0ABV8PIK0_9FLAO
MLIFKDKLPKTNRAAIVAKIGKVSRNLGIDPNWLMAVINFETAGTFSTTIQNPYTGATGLIQFNEDFRGAGYKTVGGTRYPITEIRGMDHLQQLELIERYYAPYRNKIKGFVDLYLATFFPLAMGKPDDWVLRTDRVSARAIAEANPVFDQGGQVTVGSIKKGLLTKVPAQYLGYLIKNSSKGITLVVLVALGIVIYNMVKSN